MFIWAFFSANNSLIVPELLMDCMSNNTSFVRLACQLISSSSMLLMSLAIFCSVVSLFALAASIFDSSKCNVKNMTINRIIIIGLVNWVFLFILLN